MNYAVQTVYAEAGDLKEGTTEERKAMADVLTNRIGASNISGGIATTYRGVIEASGQFECFKNKETKKPSSKFIKGGNFKKLKGDDAREWNLDYDAVATEVKECGGTGPKYEYTFNLRAGDETGSGWVQIGSTVFKSNPLVVRKTK